MHALNLLKFHPVWNYILSSSLKKASQRPQKAILVLPRGSMLKGGNDVSGIFIASSSTFSFPSAPMCSGIQWGTCLCRHSKTNLDLVTGELGAWNGCLTTRIDRFNHRCYGLGLNKTTQKTKKLHNTHI